MLYITYESWYIDSICGSSWYNAFKVWGNMKWQNKSSIYCYKVLCCYGFLTHDVKSWIEPVFIDCKNPRSVYYILFMPLKVRKNNLKSPIGKIKQRTKNCNITRLLLHPICALYVSLRESRCKYGVQSRWDYAVIRYLL